ncbi:MAG: hypothetical protein O9322_13620 [Beijerinckiaceae bacterium]|nr:hypothetical protein [Beijerinckiaceae bacterium]MCZ8300385.1 hypothetical protein [Beijerinckiaceae bacterium]
MAVLSASDTVETAGSLDATSYNERRYVDWGAIAAGGIIASAITLVLSGFGTALGLSLTSVRGSGLSAVGLSVAAGLWLLWVAISSLIAGAYVTGRLRRRAGDANRQEVVVRDGAHGLVVWALSVLIGAVLAMGVLSGFARTGGEVALAATTAIGAAAGPSADYALDVLTRSDNASALDEPTKQQIGRILLHSLADGQLSPDDRSYLSRSIATRTGIAPDEIDRRIDITVTRAKTALAQAQIAADKARRLGILVAFLTAAAMALGAAAAWWGAIVGGRHRDENTDLSTYLRW